MAKKRTIRKKASRSGKAQHDSEILRAKRAVSAALTQEGQAIANPAAESPSAAPAPPQPKVPLDVSVASNHLSSSSSAPRGLPSIMKGLVRAAAGLVGHDVQPVADELPPLAQPSLTVSCNPLAELARRHASNPGKFLPGFAQHTDELCHHVLADLAKTTLQSSSQSH